MGVWITPGGMDHRLPNWQTSKFADDTAIVGCIRSGQEDKYRELIKDFITWCDSNHLLLNTTKTREMVVDFRRPRPHPEPVIIKGDCVEVVHTYKYLGPGSAAG
ncbi:hypothetical protein L3Q82_000377 [Scortum barcoo]|uniref:Uncharacterized protein n=1 Tax=Scortum barcoo TaxID=214431 RepID=A0ACB8XA27_9TELE|nr:hypothetical protein L3Q82_000377 [Scortum barcoo]